MKKLPLAIAITGILCAPFSYSMNDSEKKGSTLKPSGFGAFMMPAQPAGGTTGAIIDGVHSLSLKKQGEQLQGVFNAGAQAVVTKVKPEFIKILEDAKDDFDPAWMYSFFTVFSDSIDSVCFMNLTSDSKPASYIEKLQKALVKMGGVGTASLQLGRLITAVKITAEKHNNSLLVEALSSLLSKTPSLKQDVIMHDRPVNLADLMPACETLGQQIATCIDFQGAYLTMSFNMPTYDCIYTAHYILGQLYQGVHEINLSQYYAEIEKYVAVRPNITAKDLFADAARLGLTPGKVLVYLFALQRISEVKEAYAEANRTNGIALEPEIQRAFRAALRQQWAAAEVESGHAKQGLLAELSLRLSQHNFLVGDTPEATTLKNSSALVTSSSAKATDSAGNVSRLTEPEKVVSKPVAAAEVAKSSELASLISMIATAPASPLPERNTTFDPAIQTGTTQASLQQLMENIPDCGGLKDEGLFRSWKLCPKPSNVPASYDAKYAFCISDMEDRSLPVFIANPYSVGQVADVVKSSSGLKLQMLPVNEFKEKIRKNIVRFFESGSDINWFHPDDADTPLDVRDVFTVVESETQHIMPQIAHNLSYQSVLNAHEDNEYYLLMMRRAAGTDWQTDIIKVKSVRGKCAGAMGGSYKYYEMSSKEGATNYFEVKSFDASAEAVFTEKFGKSLQNSKNNKITVLFATLRGTTTRYSRIRCDGSDDESTGISRGLITSSDRHSGTHYQNASVSSDKFTIIGASAAQYLSLHCGKKPCPGQGITGA